MTEQDNPQVEMATDNKFQLDACPILIPRELLEKMLKRPFHKRHPIICWTLLLLVIFMVIYGITALLFDDDEQLPTEDSLALVNIRGAILDPASTLAWIRKIEGTPSIKGILLRIDSPGGGAAASQEIYDALARVANKIPVAASMGSMAASGGLMVAMAARKIFANPSTVTGSIGVRMDIPQLQDLMAKIGIGQETLVTAPFKDAASYTHPLTPQAREYLESVLMDMHEQFVAIVAKGRNMDPEQVRKLANGKIFTGQQALKLGLVDEMGGQYEAHGWLCKETGIERKKKLARPRTTEQGTIKWLFSRLSALLEIPADNLGLLLNQASRPAFLYQF